MNKIVIITPKVGTRMKGFISGTLVFINEQVLAKVYLAGFTFYCRKTYPNHYSIDE